ncbi:hypothetical protein ACFFRR_003395 [Megaselia abdita]
MHWKNLFVSLVLFVGLTQAIQINPFKKYSVLKQSKGSDNYITSGYKQAAAPLLIKSQPVLLHQQHIAHAPILLSSHGLSSHPIVALHHIPAHQLNLQHLQIDSGETEAKGEEEGGEEAEGEGEENKEAEYEFSYSVNDEKTGDIKNVKETRKGDLVEGSYDLIDADGFKRTVEYKSEGKKGFTAVVKREPTDIKIEGQKDQKAEEEKQYQQQDEGSPYIIQHQPILVHHQQIPLVHYAPSKKLQQLKYILSDVSLKENRKNDLRRRKEEEEENEKARVEYNSPHATYRY